METLTTQAQRDSIQKLIATELLKRGYTAQIISFKEVENRRGGNRLEFKTADFQTVPVMFEQINVENFSSSLSQEEKENAKGEKYMTTSFWINVNVAYHHFTGGSNGCTLFDISGKFYGDNDHADYKIK